MAHQTQPVAVPLRGSPSFSDFSLGASSWSQEDSFSLLEQRREAPALGRPGIETAVPFPRRLSLPAKLPALFPLGKPSHPSAGKASSNESVPDILALRSLNLSGGGEESPAGSPNSSAPSLSPRSPPTDEIFEADAAAEYQNMVKARSDAMRAFSAAPYP